MKLIHEDLTYQLRGIFYQTYNALGPGFDETLYRDIAFEKCTAAGIEAKKEHRINVIYKGHEIALLRLDLFVDDKVIVEFKAVEKIVPAHKAQLICYLKATAKVIGLLANFSLEGVSIERVASFPKTVEMVKSHDYYSRNKDQLADVRRTDSSDEVVFKVISGICEVWNELSDGYLESVYYRALEVELGVERGYFDREQEFDVFLDGHRIGKQRIPSVLNEAVWVCLTSTTKPPNRLERKIRSIVNRTSLKCAILANLSGIKPTIQWIESETA